MFSGISVAGVSAIFLAIKTLVLPIYACPQAHLREILQNIRAFVTSFVIFLMSGLYFGYRFETDFWQDRFSISVALLLFSMSLTFVSGIGLILFGFLCAIPTPSWIRAYQKARENKKETDVWVDYDA